MGKKEFLSELEKSLSVLQEDELKDIISEYEQHIDIKVEKGLTEEEAIADFGSLQELTGEILEAYHVRADYGARVERSRRKPGKGQAQKEADGLGRLNAEGEKGGISLYGRVKKAGIWLADMVRRGWRQLCRPFAWVRSRAAAHLLRGEGARGETVERLSGETEGRTAQGMETMECRQGLGEERITKKGGEPEYVQRRRVSGKMTGKAVMMQGAGAMGRGWNALCRCVKTIWQWGLEGVLWGIRLAWNGCWVLFSLFAGGFGLFSLFGMGVLAVLLMQGYPLVGVTVGCAGLVCCLFSAAGLGMTLLWHKDCGSSADAVPKEKEEYPERVRRRVHRPQRVTKVREKESEIQREKGDGEDA